DSRNAEAYYSRAIYKSELNDYLGAILDYDEAIKINPDDADSYLNRGTCKQKTGNVIGACLDWKKAVESGGLGSDDLKAARDSISKNCK
ncbi:MAG TPA: tetratricopeptide repeat protein, partial [Nitrosopumilaceae archaeon]|nr:tetratricopeptide repeat protein [Nitrosopumilaceae archaeon]